ncbi:MAG: type IV pilus modification PilV family protein [Candidatus Scalindua sp.]
MENKTDKTSIFNLQSSIDNYKSQSGFTLIEICIAIFILGFGLISMLTIFPIGVDSMRKVTQYSNAAILSESAISVLIKNKDNIIGTMTAGIPYVYPDDDVNTSTPFTDSSDPPNNIIFPQYSWQAILKSISATDKNLFRAQIAIFRNFNSAQFGTGTADFTNGVDTVSYTPPLPTGLTAKDYIREDDDDNSDKFWYRIDRIGTSTSTITLEGPFLGSGGAGLTFSTTKNIIDIHETMFSKR